MEKQKIWTISKKIGYNQINPQGKLHLSSLFDFLQEAAWTHAEHIGFGYDFVNEQQKAFVLYQVDVNIKRLPVCNEDIHISTWPSALNRIFAERDYEIKNGQGEVLIEASSQWIIIDTQTRKAIRPTIMTKFLPYVTERKMIDQKKNRALKIDKALLEYVHQVQYSEIDINGHTNTSRYLEWIQNMVKEDLNIQDGDRFSISFVSESKLNESIHLKCIQQENTYHIEAKRDQDTIIIAKLIKATN